MNTQALAELLPCPWCKGRPEDIYATDYNEWYSVACVCGARGPEYDTAAAAITAWNTRQAASGGVDDSGDYRAATPEEELGIDDACGLVKVTFRLSKELLAEVDAAADWNKLVRPAMIRHMLRYALDTKPEAAPALPAAGWISAGDSKPPEDTPVWCSINGAEPFFGTYSYAEGDEDGAGWAWMRCDSQPYFHGGKWKCDDIEWDDQYDVTRWMLLPALPAPPAGEWKINSTEEKQK